MREDGGVWRHELKFVCTMPQLKIIENRIMPLLAPDPHTGPEGSYQISSVYFDDQWDTCFYENEDGTDPREKFRIRIYNGSDEKITLELKQKLRGKTRKLSCPVSRTIQGNLGSIIWKNSGLITGTTGVWITVKYM